MSSTKTIGALRSGGGIVSEVKAVAGGFMDGAGSVRGLEPTITALWAAVAVLQEDVAELQREIFSEDGE